MDTLKRLINTYKERQNTPKPSMRCVFQNPQWMPECMIICNPIYSIDIFPYDLDHVHIITNLYCAAMFDVLLLPLHHYFCTLKPLSSKIRVIGVQIL